MALVMLLMLVIVRAWITISGWEVYFYVHLSKWGSWPFIDDYRHSFVPLKLRGEGYKIIRWSQFVSLHTWLLTTLLSSHLCWQMCAVLEVAERRTKQTLLIFSFAFFDIFYHLMIYTLINRIYGIELPPIELQLILSVPFAMMVLHTSIQWFFFVNNKSKFRYLTPEARNHVWKNRFFNVIVILHAICKFLVISVKHNNPVLTIKFFMLGSLEIFLRIFMIKEHCNLLSSYSDALDNNIDSPNEEYQQEPQQESSFDKTKSDLVSGDDHVAVMDKIDESGWGQSFVILLMLFAIVDIAFAVKTLL